MAGRPPARGEAAGGALVSIPPPAGCVLGPPLCRQPWGGVGNRGTVGPVPARWLPSTWLLADGGPSATLAAAYASPGFLADGAAKPQPGSWTCPCSRGSSSKASREGEGDGASISMDSPFSPDLCPGFHGPCVGALTAFIPSTNEG